MPVGGSKRKVGRVNTPAGPWCIRVSGMHGGSVVICKSFNESNVKVLTYLLNSVCKRFLGRIEEEERMAD
jgi:hypothetical protein